MPATKIFSIIEDNSAISLSLLIVLNYIAWACGWGVFFGPIIISVFILLFLVFGLIVAFSNEGKFLVFLYSMSLLIFALGSRTTGWDTRTIWLFHAKRIYFDSNLYTQLDNYGSFSHNDYPIIIPALAASFCILVDGWNEIFPKISSSMALCAALIFLSNYQKNQLLTLLFIFALTLIFGYHKVDVGSYLTNGYMDPILALYTLLAVILTQKIIKRVYSSDEKSWFYDVFSFSIVGFILVLIKNEGFFLLISIMLASFVSNGFRINGRLIIAALIPILTTLIWRYLVAKSGIVNDLAESNIFEKLYLRILDYHSWLLILTKIPIYFWFLIISYLFMNKYYMCNIINIKKLVKGDPVIIFVFIYSTVLAFVYITTRHDLEWHLETSVDRTILPLSVVLLYFTLYPVKNTRKFDDIEV